MFDYWRNYLISRDSRDKFIAVLFMPTNVLVLGGVGFIGRTFVAYLIDNNLVGSVRVVDKVLPATAYLSEHHKAVFADPRVDFKQANLVNAASTEKVFDGNFDIVFNLASETKYGLAQEVFFIDLGLRREGP
jgi:dTDP-D-glucose 4,6-dehydratase